MVQISRSLVRAVETATSVSDLYGPLQSAIALEHSTIPPYLTAVFTIKPDTNQDVTDIILSVVREEMLHMTIAANILTAIGGSPNFTNPQFIPSYPTKILTDLSPDGTVTSASATPIDDGLTVSVAPMSLELVHDTFMRIEQPDQPLPLHITGGGIAAYPAAQQISGDFASIGDFYTALFQQIASFAKQGDIFTGSPSNQVTPATTGTTWYDRLDWFPIKNLDDVQKGIQVIISQGEGADNTPADLDGNPSHFYRFGQIYWGRKLIPDTTSEYGWSYTGPAVMLETSDVLPMPANMKVSDYEPGTRAAVLTSQFSQAYMQVLNLMQQAFNGNPQMLNGAIRLMFQLRIMAYEVLTQPYPTDTAPVIGLTFEYSSIIT